MSNPLSPTKVVAQYVTFTTVLDDGQVWEDTVQLDPATFHLNETRPVIRHPDGSLEADNSKHILWLGGYVAPYLPPPQRA